MKPLIEKHILIGDIVFDRALQMRVEGVDTEFADTLAEVLREDPHAQLDPIVVFADESEAKYYCGDGWHRGCAYRLVHREKAMVPCIVHDGGRDAALRYALGANADQRAKPRTRKDLRRAVVTALDTYYFSKGKNDRPSQAEIASICHTTQQTISIIAREIERAMEASDRNAAKRELMPEPPQRQLDFFQLFARDYQPAGKSLKGLIEGPIWLLPVPKEQKLEALKIMREDLQTALSRIKSVESDLEKSI